MRHRIVVHLSQEAQRDCALAGRPMPDEVEFLLAPEDFAPALAAGAVVRPDGSVELVSSRREDLRLPRVPESGADAVALYSTTLLEAKIERVRQWLADPWHWDRSGLRDVDVDGLPEELRVEIEAVKRRCQAEIAEREARIFVEREALVSAYEAGGERPDVQYHWAQDHRQRCRAEERRRDEERANVMRAERDVWIEAHGSERLRTMVRLGIGAVDRLYEQERLALERPGWHVQRASEEERDRTFPSIDELAELEAARELDPDVELVWLVEHMDDELTKGSALVADYRGVRIARRVGPATVVRADDE